MRRRSIVIAVLAALLLAPEWTTAQQPRAKTPRIGILSPAKETSTKIFDAFREGLRDLGYVDSQNIIIEYRLAAANFSRLPAMAGELVRLPVDIIVVDGGPNVAQIAKDATSTIPIVGGLGADPVAAGLVRSFAHPGGNVTGFATLGIELSGKRLQLLKEAFPETSRVAVLRNSATANLSALHATDEAAHTLGVQLRRIDINGPDEITTRFEAAVSSGGAEALVVEADAVFWNERKQIVALAAEYRVPAIYPEREYVDDGGLLAYGRNVLESWGRAVRYVDQILKGAKPGDLPIEQPTKFELVVNLKAAKALGLTIPLSFLARADEVIE